MMATDSLSLIFSALSDPTRRSILSRLSSGDLSVTEIASSYKMSFPAITKHLKVLEKAGLISRSKEAQWRPCQLEAQKMQEVDDWISLYRHHWEETFDRLDSYLIELQNKKLKTSKRKKYGKAKKK